MDDETLNDRDAGTETTSRLSEDGGGDGGLVAALAALRPADVRPDAEAALFEAGRRVGEQAARAAARRQLFAWRAAAAVLVVAGGLATAARPGPAVVERIVYANPPPPARPPGSTDFPTDSVVPARRGVSASDPRGSWALGPAAEASAAADLRADSLLALRQVGIDQGVDRLPPGERGWVSGVRVRGLSLP